MPDLLHDLDRPLPVAWDGRPLEWSPWAQSSLVFICDRSKRKNGLTHPTCSACGSQRPALTSVALRSPLPTDTIPGEVLRIHRNGEPVHAQEPAPAYRDLHASRCLDCGHDSVVDIRTGEAWDLDPSDYGPEGSVAP